MNILILKISMNIQMKLGLNRTKHLNMDLTYRLIFKERSLTNENCR
nr:MAG TPA: hypothetical protein [Caudoviricetes sp.]